ncbi:CDP-diacylglycerol--serine O-phosphatidyltransferase [Candidatus Palibaumannia cicadellinicola]|uniref:CDP-diacylglycerol--serine O-phosphatidyltransferase n=1 Tax=Baumannia cicadellinicola subsp. Homalodisca coagulata TaxID=374463 RepID=Q1LU60_BAUCH|nr:CDP-diacylglycerol--serine O-phosphatidyltransferase [Candidatus Baumannia cicadellinicola]ABF13872.1 CDP-diacylglycerol--serine O-phosphatidyltransferase [Baumannia cicadellinicola str. Hc (Homalodisca coagulata)]MBS0032571.1 CDP-diacylglycerol--serine O-phosphatidyltransferase [Candidatus Baumannia cicadellinicola]MCJ7462013.1 CDP-diacylglycerol--serine O-phosphatidyltransferase [Candidatus Baumannia cicadellinicola]MCJ7462562.1 CDP-diacylglycerol--serine O-phosphatidyltransferase [Candida
MLLTFKYSRKNKQYLLQLPKIAQIPANIQTLYSPQSFCETLLKTILTAKYRIYIVALSLEQDQGGKVILDALYQARQFNSYLEIAVLVDWHRAQRSRIGSHNNYANAADWYFHMVKAHPGIEVPVYGVPINTREALGVLHLKGFIIDDQVIYSGASLNNVYLHQQGKYRYDRYHIIRNLPLADSLLSYIKQQFFTTPAVNRLDIPTRIKRYQIKHYTKLLRQSLRDTCYSYKGSATLNELAITPLVGLGKQSILNQTIYQLICTVNTKIILCTPYFNMPRLLMQNLVAQLRKGKMIEIIVGDKTANDFYISHDKPFKMINMLPYLYEMNLRNFLYRLQRYIDNGQLTVRLWKNGENSYHVKGIWVDNEWLLLTSNNLNSRSWLLDLENGLLIHDHYNQLYLQSKQELSFIRTYTKVILHFNQLQSIAEYPTTVRKIIYRLRPILIDRLISKLL